MDIGDPSDATQDHKEALGGKLMLNANIKIKIEIKPNLNSVYIFILTFESASEYH